MGNYDVKALHYQYVKGETPAWATPEPASEPPVVEDLTPFQE
jgi:hypothetical protein